MSPQLHDWLAARGLGDAEVLAMVPNAQLDRMTRQELREWHRELERQYQQRHLYDPDGNYRG